jgi:hypothetical protein
VLAVDGAEAELYTPKRTKGNERNHEIGQVRKRKKVSTPC